MARTPFRVGPELVATGPATVYTAPVGGALLRWVNVANPSAGSVTFTMSVGADGTGTRVYDGEAIGADGRLIDYPYLELDEGDTIQISSSSNNVLVFTAGGDVLSVIGSVPLGTPVLRGPFVLNYDDAGLNTGLEFYTPTPGDFVLDVFVVVDTAFDGTTPEGDFGITSGFFATFASGNGFSMAGAAIAALGAGLLAPSSYSDAVTASAYNNGAGMPLLVSAANPLKVWVSQDGLKGGAAVGGTTGAARLYIVTATPVAL